MATATTSRIATTPPLLRGTLRVATVRGVTPRGKPTGGVATVTVAVTEHHASTPRWQTTSHRLVDHIQRLTITANYPGGGGQADWVLDPDDPDVLDLLISPDAAARLRGIWHYWHCNDLRPGCEHQTDVAAAWVAACDLPDDNPNCGWGRTDDFFRQECPVTGYRFGSAWLVEPLPPSLLEEIAAIVDRAGTSRQEG